MPDLVGPDDELLLVFVANDLSLSGVITIAIASILAVVLRHLVVLRVHGLGIARCHRTQLLTLFCGCVLIKRRLVNTRRRSGCGRVSSGRFAHSR